MRDYPSIASRWRVGKQVPPNASDGDAQTKKKFYALHTIESKSNDDDYDDKSFFFSL